jgi:ABC-2 type transport system permease protein
MWTITKYNFLNYFRARRFYVMLSIIVIISGLLTGLVAYYRPAEFVAGDSLGFYGAGWGSFVNLVVVLSAAFFGGDAISGEFQNRTGYFLVPNPIRRGAILTGKYLAALGASSIVLGVFALVMMANAFYYFPSNPLPGGFLQSLAFSWVYLLAALSLVFAFSSLFKNSSISILMSVILLLLVFNIVDTVASIVVGIEPWFSITYGAGIVSNILQEPYPANHISQSVPIGGGRVFRVDTYNATVPEGLAILGVYFVVMAVIGLWLFQRKEFTS